MAKEKILIIDDSREIVSFLCEKVLPGAGYQTAVAMTGQGGMQALARERPDLVLLDMELPDANGLDILRTIMKDEREFPVILMTAYGSESVAVEAFRIGARDYLIKPYTAEEVLGAIDQALTETRLRREKESLLERLGKRVQELTVLATIGKSVANLADTDKVLKRIVEAGVYITRAEEGFLLLVDSDSGDMVLRAVKNVDDKQARSLRLRVDDSLAGKVLREGKPLRLGGKAERHFKMKTGYLVKALLHVPLRLQSRSLGVLSVDNQKSSQSFDENDEYLLSVLADYAAIALENAELRTRFELMAERYQSLSGRIDEAVVVCDADLRPSGANQAALDMLGYHGHEFEELEAGHLFTPGTISQVKKALTQADPRSTEPLRATLNMITRDGSTITVQGAASVIRQGEKIEELQWLLQAPNS
jgi:two-component system NtrC family sensor kinase